MKITNAILSFFLCYSLLIGQNLWFEGNLKSLEDFSLEINIIGLEDNVWQSKLYNFSELRFLEHKILILKKQIPKLVIDINIIDSKINRTSSFFIALSLYNYSISERLYYKSIADTLITKKLMTSKLYSNEILGQSSPNSLYKDVEKSMNKLISNFIDQWYQDNPVKQFNFVD